MTSGTSPDGQVYDGVQRNIRGNHLAIVYQARCGSECRVGDSTGDCACKHNGTNRGEPMATITRIIDGITLQFADDTQASVIEKVVSEAKKRATDADARVKKAEDEALLFLTQKDDAAKTAKTAADAAVAASAKLVADHATAIAAKDKEIADLKAKQITDAQIEALAAERAKVVADAMVLVPEFKHEGKSLAAIRSEALTTLLAGDEAIKPIVDAVLGGVEIAKAEPGVVTTAFNVAVKARPAATNDAGGGTSAADSAARAARDAEIARQMAGGNRGAPKLTGRDVLMARMKNGGKDPASAASGN